MLSRIFLPDADSADSGVQLSGGQWQRLALARSYYRDAELVLLDEPTSAMDPLAEERFFNRVGDLLSNKTVLLISHRMALAQTSTRVVVLISGEIVEQGTHDELLASDGIYSEMYTAQARTLQTDWTEHPA